MSPAYQPDYHTSSAVDCPGTVPQPVHRWDISDTTVEIEQSLVLGFGYRTFGASNAFTSASQSRCSVPEAYDVPNDELG